MDKDIRDAIGIKIESTAGVEPMPSPFGRLLTACGYSETPIQPVRFAVEEIGDSGSTLFTDVQARFDMATGDGFPTLVVSADYALSAALMRSLATSGTAAVTVERRPGDTLFDIEVLDALAAAEIVVEDTPNGVVLHLPNRAGSVNGRGLAQMLTPPLTAADFADLNSFTPLRKDDYLRHDPTKRHNRRRKRR